MLSNAYSTAELVSLSIAPMSPNQQPENLQNPIITPSSSPSPSVIPMPVLRRNSVIETEFQAFHRALSSCNTATLSFANYQSSPNTPDVVIPTASADSLCPVRWAHLSHTNPLLDPHSRLAKMLRYGRSVACFNLYPACQRDLQINRLLWQLAQTGEYNPSQGNLLLENNVLSLAMPTKFFHFLSKTSEQDLKLCMLEVLALIAEDEDLEGLALMKSELADSVWNDLSKYMEKHDNQNSRIDSTTPEGLRLMCDVEMLLRLCYLSPWKIDVYAGYITPHDMNTVLSEHTRRPIASNHSSTAIPELHDRKLVRSSARRPVSSFQQSHTHSMRRCRITNRNVVFWKLFQDWRRYRMILVQGLGMSAAKVAATMLSSISRGSREQAWDSAEAVLACANIPGNLLSSLPREIVFNIIAPRVLFAASEV